MEEFRGKIKRRAYLSVVQCLLAPTLLIVLQVITKREMDYARGVVYGAFSTFTVIAVFNALRLFSTLSDEDKLKKMYIDETDERNIALNKETGSTSSTINGIGIGIGAIIASFFSTTVSLTLAAVVFFSALVTVIVKLFYNKIM